MQRFEPRRNRRVGDQNLRLSGLARAVLQAAVADHSRAAQEAFERRAAELAVVAADEPVAQEEARKRPQHERADEEVVLRRELRDPQQPAHHRRPDAIPPSRDRRPGQDGKRHHEGDEYHALVVARHWCFLSAGASHSGCPLFGGWTGINQSSAAAFGGRLPLPRMSLSLRAISRASSAMLRRCRLTRPVTSSSLSGGAWRVRAARSSAYASVNCRASAASSSSRIVLRASSRSRCATGSTCQTTPLDADACANAEPTVRLRSAHRTLSVRIEDLGNEAAPGGAFRLNDNGNDRAHILDHKRLVDARKALHHHQCELLEGKLRAIGMDCRDRSGMAAVDRAKVGERLLAAQLAEEDAIWPQAQRRFAQVLRRGACQALLSARVEKTHYIGLRRAKLARVFDDHQALANWNLLQHGIEERRFPRIGAGRDEDVLSRPDGDAQKSREVPAGVRIAQVALGLLLFAGLAIRQIEGAPPFVVGQAEVEHGRPSDRQRHAPARRWRPDELRAIAVR